MPQRVLASLLLILSFAATDTALALSAPSGPTSTGSNLLPTVNHKDERIGYRLQPPRGWKEIPLKMDEQWLVAKFVCPKVDRYNDKRFGWTWEHTPELQVIAFVDEWIQQSDFDDEEEEEESSRLRRVFRDYPDYLRKTFSEGFFIEVEESKRVGDLDVTVFEAKVEKREGYGHKRLFAHVFETDIGSIAVQFEILEDSEADHRTAIKKVFRSFKEIERTQPLELFDWSQDYLSYYALKKLSPAERANRRKEEQAAHWERLCQGLPNGWTAKSVDGVQVLNHVDDGFARKVVARVKAVTGWLEDTFEGVGPEEYARLPIVRICDDWDEEQEFRGGTAGTAVRGTELVTNKNKYGSTSVKWQYVNRRTMQIWFLDRDRDLWNSRPEWLDIGLDEVIESATASGKRLKFEVGNQEREWLQRTSREGDPISVHQLLTMPRSDFQSRAKAKDWKAWAQSVALARFLVEGKGSKGRYKDTLNLYLKNFSAALSEVEEERRSNQSFKKPTNEEEEEAYYKKLGEDFKEREKRILDLAFDRTFGAWPDSKWKSFERAFHSTVR